MDDSAVRSLFAARDAGLRDPGFNLLWTILEIDSRTRHDHYDAAMRRGLGRRPSVFTVPPTLLALSFHAAGKDYVYERLSGALVADPSALMGLGWKPPLTSAAGLAQLMQTPDE